jgi:hypothetical protein
VELGVFEAGPDELVGADCTEVLSLTAFFLESSYGGGAETGDSDYYLTVASEVWIWVSIDDGTGAEPAFLAAICCPMVDAT